MKPVKFASIPRCASRSLLQMGILGETGGRYHTRIVDYPSFQEYDWHAVIRPEREWFSSWWSVQKKLNYRGHHEFNLRLENEADDYNRLHDLPLLRMPRRKGINAWMPENFIEDWEACRQAGTTFFGYCVGIICGTVPVKFVELSALNEWARAHGIQPVHTKAGV